jgi:hypothetical protein
MMASDLSAEARLDWSSAPTAAEPITAPICWLDWATPAGLGTPRPLDVDDLLATTAASKSG